MQEPAWRWEPFLRPENRASTDKSVRSHTKESCRQGIDPQAINPEIGFERGQLVFVGDGTAAGAEATLPLEGCTLSGEPLSNKCDLSPISAICLQ
jgi:hypothetical protein